MSGQSELVRLVRHWVQKGELIVLLPSHLRPAVSVVEQETVTDYAIEARYPGVWEPITRTEAEDVVAIARRVREAIRLHLPNEAVDYGRREEGPA